MLFFCCFFSIDPSVCFRLTCQILNEWFGRSIIRSCVKLSYDHAQSMIEAPEKMFSAEELPPVDPMHPIDEVHQAVLNLHTIAKNLRAQRFLGGALRLDQVSVGLFFGLWEEILLSLLLRLVDVWKICLYIQCFILDQRNWLQC